MCRSYVEKLMFRSITTGLATTMVLMAHSAAAQPVNGCPAGQAMQSSDPGGRNVTCVAIPSLSGLQGQITTLQSRLNDETAARLATEAELRASIGGAETSIVGRYTFTGTQSCVNSSQGFDPATFLPIVLPSPPQPVSLPPMPPQTVIGPSTFVGHFTSTVSGFRTFNADKTGTADFFAHTIFQSTLFYANGFNSNGQPFMSAGVAAGPGGATTSHFTGSFTWDIVGGKLYIYEPAIGPTGTVTSGGTRVGWISSTENLPPMVGVLGKDLRIISMVHEASGIEFGVQSNPNGIEVFRTPRICHRERTLRRIDG
ncbi:MAG TPA: hypothetical protein VJT77_08690 [Burkholderiales bacterium]|nr:hypothetical protein [Burkholderiales bacterium]